MKRLYKTTSIIVTIYLFLLQSLSLQGQDFVLEIKSEHKKIWSDSTEFSNILVKLIRQHSHLIEQRQIETLNKEFKKYVKNEDRTLRNVDLDKYQSRLSLTTFLYKSQNKVYLKLKITKNILSFDITTPDVIFGIGSDRKKDPHVSVTYDVEADIPIEQNNTMKPIKFGLPIWRTPKITNFYASNLEERTIPIGKIFIKAWISNTLFDLSDYRNAFFVLDEISDKYNNFINSEIKQNTALLAELKLDENQQLQVINSGDSKLIFQHNYTPSGIVKRNVTTNPDEILGKPNSTQPTTVPVSTSPAGGIGGKNNSSKPPPIIKKPVRKN